MQEARAGGQQGGGGRGGGIHMGGGIPGMGGGPYGGRRGGGQGENEDDQQRMRDLVNPANSLTIAQTGAEVDLFDDQGRKLALVTDGRKVEKSKDNANQEIAAHWDNNRLVTDEKSPRGGKMSRTLELSSDGTQLYETLLLPPGRSGSSVSIRYVYDIPPSSAPAANTRPASSAKP